MNHAPAILVALLCIPGTVFGQDLKRNHYESYLGVGAGQSNLRTYCKDVDSIAGFSGTCDNSNVGLKVFGGYKINRWAAAELGYTNFGEGRADGTLSGNPAVGRWQGYGIDLSAIGTLPFGQHFEMFIKGGLLYWDVKSTTTNAASREISDNGFSGVVGGGATFWFTQQAGLRLQYERFHKVGDSSVRAQTSIDFASLSLVGRF